jgi:hypothetical protein
LSLFFLSFLMSGNGNALPQVFLQRGFPEQKASLLALTLLASTVAAVLGTSSARHVRLQGRGVALGLLGAVAVAALLLSVQGLVPFVLLLSLSQFASNFMLNLLDHAAVQRAGAHARFNDTVGNGARLCGMLLAPVFFTASAGDPALQRLVIAFLGLAALGGCLGLLRLPSRAEVAEASHAATSRANGRDRLLFAYALAVYAAMYLLAANLIFLLQDLLQRPDAERLGGLLIALVFASAIVANAATGPVRQRLGSAFGSVRLLLAMPALALAGAAAVLLAGLRPGNAACFAAAVCIGAAYGVFLHELRSHVSAAARAGRPVLIAWFNNVANLSALLAFGVMLVLSRAVAPADYPAAVMGFTVALTLGGVALLCGMPRGASVGAGARPSATPASSASEPGQAIQGPARS